MSKHELDYAVEVIIAFLRILREKYTDQEIQRMLSPQKLKGALKILEDSDRKKSQSISEMMKITRDLQ